MYLVIKEIRGKINQKQVPLRLYKKGIGAYNYIEQYMKDSCGEKWHKETFNPLPITNKFICRQRWLRKLKNGDIECLKVKYLKVYMEE